jgi:DNA primase
MIEYSRSGQEITMSCPSCGKEDHFYYNMKKNLCICQKCKWATNHVGFLIEGLGYEKSEAVRAVFGKLDTSFKGIKGRVQKLLTDSSVRDLGAGHIYFQNQLPEGIMPITRNNFPKALAERGISFFLINKLEGSICNIPGIYNHRIIFPLRCLGTKTFLAQTGYTKRKFKIMKGIYKSKGNMLKKTMFPKGSFMGEVLYPYSHISFRRKRLFVVEGLMDVCKLFSRTENAVATLGSHVTPEQAILLSMTKATEIYLMMDGDVSITNMLRYGKLLEKVCFDKKIRICILPEDEDPDSARQEDLDEAIENCHTVMSLEMMEGVMKDG